MGHGGKLRSRRAYLARMSSGTALAGPVGWSPRGRGQEREAPWEMLLSDTALASMERAIAV